MRPSRLINVAAIQTHDVPRVGILTPERSVTAVPQGLFGGATCVPYRGSPPVKKTQYRLSLDPATLNCVV